MSPNPHQPRPRHTRRMRDPRTRFQTVVRPEGATESPAESSPGQSPPPPSPRRADAPEGTILYPYIISDLKVSSLLMAGAIILLIILWVLLK